MKRISIHVAYASLLITSVLITSLLQPLRHLDALAQGAAQPGCQMFKETGQSVCGKFLTYWNAHGGLAQQGFPIGPELREVSELNGTEYTVQYFERAVFELHPENQPPNDVLLSQLGTYQARRRYSNPPVWQGVATPPSVQLQPGVSVSLMPHSTQFAPYPWITGLEAGCGGSMVWVVRLENASNKGYTTVLDKGYYMADSTGREYRTLRPNCGANPVGDLTHAPATVQAAQASEIGLALATEGLPSAATYLELHLGLSGTPVTFRYNLR